MRQTDRKEGFAMKTGLALLLAGTLALTLATVAPAHTLSRAEAANEAWLAVDDYAESQERWFEVLVDVDLTRRDCLRFTRHRFECVGSFDYETIDGEVYDDGTTWMGCVADVTVRYAGSRSWRVLTRVYDVKCF
jgi:hypothetical protein